MRVVVTFLIGLSVSVMSGGQGDAKKLNETLKKKVNRIAVHLKSGTKKDLKLAQDLATELLNPHDEDAFYDSEFLFGIRRPTRRMTAFGVGPKPGTTKPDGIEVMILKISRHAPSKEFLKEHSAHLMELGYRTAAIAEVQIAVARSIHFTKEYIANNGKRTKANWFKHADASRREAIAFVAAVKTQQPVIVHKSAQRLFKTCTDCHALFRD